MSAKKNFERFDKNKDGKLSLDEFCELALAFSQSYPQEEIEKLFKEIDVDGEGELDVDEFTSSVEKLLKDAFAFCDADGDGKITSNEFYVIMTGLGKEYTEKRCAEMVRAMNPDGDGYLTFEDFMAIVINMFA